MTKCKCIECTSEAYVTPETDGYLPTCEACFNADCTEDEPCFVLHPPRSEPSDWSEQ